MNVRAVLLLGGMGVRFGKSQPKQFHFLAGKKIYLHTLETFLASNLFCEVLLVIPSASKQEVVEDCKIYSSSSIKIIEGGKTRQESSFRGVIACPQDTEIVVIHDAVRPFISQNILKTNIALAREFGAVNTCIPSSDTLVFAPQGSFIESVPNRSEFFRGQTPQSFKFEIIKQAHLHAKQLNLVDISDDCRLVKELGQPIALALGDERNIKITTPLDLSLAEQILRQPASDDSGPHQINLSGSIFAITGGTGGIGKEVAGLLENEGAKALLLSPSSTEFFLDFRRPETIKSCFESIRKKFGDLSGLINCAGYLDRASLEQLSPDSIDAQIDINFRGVVHSCKQVGLKPGGQILNISSSSYLHGRREIAVYAAAKAAIVNFSQGLALERPDLIINVAAPSRTDTPMRKESFPEEEVRFLLSAKEVATTILDLLKQNKKFASVIEIRAH